MNKYIFGGRSLGQRKAMFELLKTQVNAKIVCINEQTAKELKEYAIRNGYQIPDCVDFEMKPYNLE